MKVLVVYDSVYGNTEKVANAIAAAFPYPKILRQTMRRLPTSMGSTC
jgi:menaquinone-dependent protoporphyrinogen IX oxidase